MTQDNLPDQTGKLTFEGEKGAGRSKWIAMILGLVLVGWMGSGFVLPSEPEEVAEETAPKIRAIAVSVMESKARDVQQVFTAEGQSEPDRITSIRAETSGDVESVSVERGDLLATGQEIARIASGTAEAQLKQAQESKAQAERTYQNTVALQGRGVATEDRLTETRTALASAETQLRSAQQALDNTIIRAPFPGRLSGLTLDEGEYVSTGSQIGEILDNDPLTIAIQVPQQALSRLKRGQPAQVEFITGENRIGTVGFVGMNANAQTRTFLAEITVDNPDSALPSGLSAKVSIPTGAARGHFISPAILSLSTAGELGVKVVSAGNVVEFAPVSIVRAQRDGVWITGLPETAQIITVGQGFVNGGEVVDPRVDEKAMSALEAALKTVELTVESKQ
jgi:multidrug efflux system membrane fusion protein